MAITPEEKQEIIDEVKADLISEVRRLISEIRQEIINAAVEKTLLLTPETMSNLMIDHVTMTKINSDFYKDHPEFKDHKDVVMSVIEATEGKNSLLDYKDILSKAVPEIRERIKTVGNLDMKNVSSNPDRAYESLPSAKIENIHGEL